MPSSLKQSSPARNTWFSEYQCRDPLKVQEIFLKIGYFAPFTKHARIWLSKVCTFVMLTPKKWVWSKIIMRKYGISICIYLNFKHGELIATNWDKLALGWQRNIGHTFVLGNFCLFHCSLLGGNALIASLLCQGASKALNPRQEQ